MQNLTGASQIKYISHKVFYMNSLSCEQMRTQETSFSFKTDYKIHNQTGQHHLLTKTNIHIHAMETRHHKWIPPREAIVWGTGKSDKTYYSRGAVDNMGRAHALSRGTNRPPPYSAMCLFVCKMCIVPVVSIVGMEHAHALCKGTNRPIISHHASISLQNLQAWWAQAYWKLSTND